MLQFAQFWGIQKQPQCMQSIIRHSSGWEKCVFHQKRTSNSWGISNFHLLKICPCQQSHFEFSRVLCGSLSVFSSPSCWFVMDETAFLIQMMTLIIYFFKKLFCFFNFSLSLLSHLFILVFFMVQVFLKCYFVLRWYKQGALERY